MRQRAIKPRVELSYKGLYDIGVKLIEKLSLVLKKAFLPLLGVTLLYTFLDQWITAQSQESLSQTNEAATWAWVFLLLIVHLLLPTLTTLLTAASIKATSLKQFVAENYEQTLIETLRSWGNALLWTFAFVIPGLIRFLQYSYVPFVVALSPGYQAGEEDALEKSRQIFKKTWKALILNYLLWSVLTSLLLLPFDESRILWKSLPIALVLMILEMLFSLILSLKILEQFERGLK